MAKIALPNLSFFRDDFRMTTLLLAGASVQCLLFLLLPTYVALLPTFSLIVLRIFTFILISSGILRDPSFDSVKLGRFTAQIPHEDGSAPKNAAEKEVVILVLGARSNQYDPNRPRPHMNTKYSPQCERSICTWLHGDWASLPTYVAGCSKESREMGLSVGSLREE